MCKVYTAVADVKINTYFCCVIYTQVKMEEYKESRLKAAKSVVPGAICGDIIGSAYEFHPCKDVNLPLFTPHSRFTDDTVCTIAIADAMRSGAPFDNVMQKWCRKYPRAGYGGHFRLWIMVEDPEPYNSWGNGSAMRVSSAGAFGRNLDEVLALAKASAEITHNHPEGIKGAEATATAIYLALEGLGKEDIKTVLERMFGYDLSRDYYEIRKHYKFDVSCQGSVPESIIAFLSSTDYESAIRLAVAMGGDSDTMGAIAGGIAAAYYGGVPENIASRCMDFLPGEMGEVIGDFNEALEERYGR